MKAWLFSLALCFAAYHAALWCSGYWPFGVFDIGWIAGAASTVGVMIIFNYRRKGS